MPDKNTIIDIDLQKFEDLNKPETFTGHFEELLNQLIVKPNLEQFDLLKSQPNNRSIDLEALLQSVIVDPNKKIEKPAIVVSFNGVRICSLGNFSLVIGKPKSRKTFLITSIVSAVIIGTSSIEGLNGDLPNALHVHYFDTEQGDDDLDLTIKRIYKQIGNSNKDKIIFYRLRPIDSRLRVALIEFVIQRLEKPTFIVIDGLRDMLPKGINDESDATVVTSKLLRWTYEKKSHILLALHENKNDENARGVIGTEAVNKAETVLSVTKETWNSAISTVKAKYCRGLEFESFSFKVNEDEIPEITLETKSKVAGKKALQADTFEKMLAGNLSMSRSNLAKEYVKIQPVALVTAERHIDKNLKSGFLIKNQAGQYKLKNQPDEGYTPFKLSDKS